MKLYLIGGTKNINDEFPTDNKFLRVLESAFSSGCVDMFQLREKIEGTNTEQRAKLADRVKQLTEKYDIPFIVDDDVATAKAVGAGVHLGKDDMPVEKARKLLKPETVIGATAKTVEDAVEAVKNGASYLGTGAIFPTATKENPVITSVDTLKEIVQAVSVPVYAIGGLTADNVSVLAGSGIEGVCVVTAIIKADDPCEAAKTIKEKIMQL
jgi:thiamine-phosphate diphosphorylase